MNWLDAMLVLFVVIAIIRGNEVGFIRQFLSVFGFFVGLFIGAWAQGLTIHLVSSSQLRAIWAVLITIGFALTFMALGEFVGLLLKDRLRNAKITTKLDKIFGSALAAVALLAAVWLGAAIFRNIPDGGWNRQIRMSRIVTLLENNLPPAPTVLTKLGYLIDPNGFPQVFNGLEPRLKTDTPLPNIGTLRPAVVTARPSVVKIEGEGCNNIVEGSGFVVGDALVATNAHVVAGVKHPFVLDQKGRHGAKVLLFNADFDLAILQSDDVKAAPLRLEPKAPTAGTAVAVLGYPLGSGLTTDPGTVLETFTARGRNIYNKGLIARRVHSIKTDVHEGNSGGPVINTAGAVVGVIFAKSTAYSDVGYALTMDQVIPEVQKVKKGDPAVNTNKCTE